jgi:hypothetical protein
MKDCHINIFYSEADKGYIADTPDLEACTAFGKPQPRHSGRRDWPRRPGWKLPVPKASPLLIHSTGL